jgi:hypothetical protein
MRKPPIYHTLRLRLCCFVNILSTICNDSYCLSNRSELYMEDDGFNAGIHWVEAIANLPGIPRLGKDSAPPKRIRRLTDRAGQDDALLLTVRAVRKNDEGLTVFAVIAELGSYRQDE